MSAGHQAGGGGDRRCTGRGRGGDAAAAGAPATGVGRLEGPDGRMGVSHKPHRWQEHTRRWRPSTAVEWQPEAREVNAPRSTGRQAGRQAG